MRRSNERLVQLVALAFGEADGGAVAGVLEKERARFDQLRHLASRLSIGLFDADDATVQNAIGLMPERKRTRWKSVLAQTTLGFAGARAAVADSYQSVFTAGDASIRVSIDRSAGTTRVMGRIDQPGWTAECGVLVDCGDSGRFEFSIEPGSSTRIRFVSEEAEFEIDVSEALDDGAGA